jgi:hydrogenase nickel incorporation protein HypB
MCTVCGCSAGEVRIEGQALETVQHAHDHTHEHGHSHTHADGSTHSHAHTHAHVHAHSHDAVGGHSHVHADDALHADGHSHDHHHGHDHAHGHDGVHRHEMPSRLIAIEEDILSRNDAVAATNRAAFERDAVLALNLVSSPGSGKTTLLVETLKRLSGQLPLAVIEGDQETSDDADRIRATGVPAIQVNTGKGCHLDAAMVAAAWTRVTRPVDGILFIENVGNLVCPAGFDLGEAHKVVMCSVTEGEDKPLKYPDMFAAADLMLVTKTDLAPHCDVSVDGLIANARRVNPRIRAISLSARTGAGMESWLTWLSGARAMQTART